LHATEGTWRSALSAGAWHSIAAGSTLLAFSLGMFLVARRATGDVASPLPAALLIPTAATLVAWAWVLRFSQPDIGSWWLPKIAGRAEALFGIVLPLVTVLLFTVGVSYPGSRLVDWLVWITAYAALVLGPRWLISPRRGTPAATRRRRSQRLTQDIKRYRDDEGHECVRGMLTADFSPGQRTETLYVGFCPPFEFLPIVTAHAAGNTRASVKVAQVLHNGVQLEVRLPHAAPHQEVTKIEILAAEPEPC
jgi:hypothetical protein